MTRETKVGLIVGLAFIVVFAVILSHRGAERPATRTGDLGPIAQAPSPPVPPSPAVSRDVRAARETELRDSGRGAMSTERSIDARERSLVPPAGGNDGASRDSRSGTTSERESSLPRLPVNSIRDAVGTLSPALNNWLETATGGNESIADRRAPEPIGGLPGVPPDGGVAPAVHADPSSVGPTPTHGESPAGVTPTGTEHGDTSGGEPRVLKEHIAQKGESLTRIAQNVYGRSGKREIQAILDANRDKLPDANTLRAGQKLIIPELPPEKFEPASFPPPRTPSGDETRPPTGRSLSAERTVRASDVPTGAETPSSSGREATNNPPPDSTRTAEAPKPRTHVVKRNETYVAIARSELGDADRWKEIHSLNKATYPDPAKVPAGAKILLPPNG